MHYSNLEPNHSVHEEPGYIIVVCPFTNPDSGAAFETSWSGNAEDDEISCLFCEWLNGALHLAGAPEHGAGPE